MSTTSNKVEHKAAGEQETKTGLTLRVVSFGYKMGKPPVANAIFDVRFLKNPYWVENLRPMTGKDKPVQEYVMNQKIARDFFDGLIDLLGRLLPMLQENNMTEYHIAFGCTGGQHRSATMVELMASELARRFPELTVERHHRELDGKSEVKSDSSEDGK